MSTVHARLRKSRYLIDALDCLIRSRECAAIGDRRGAFWFLDVAANYRRAARAALAKVTV